MFQRVRVHDSAKLHQNRQMVRSNVYTLEERAKANRGGNTFRHTNQKQLTFLVYTNVEMLEGTFFFVEAPFAVSSMLILKGLVQDTKIMDSFCLFV